MGINFKNSRILGSLIIVVAVLLLLGGRLIQVQVAEHEELLAKSKISSSYKVKIPAARGEILDRNGQKLVTNRQGNALVVVYGNFPSKEDNASRNAVLLNTLNLLESKGEGDKIVTHFPLEQDAAGNIIFAADSEREVATLKSKDQLHLASYATADDCYKALVKKYELEPFSTADALRVGALRYELDRSGFAHSTPVTIAEDVADDTVLVVKGNADFAYTGIDVQVMPYREYADGTIAPHLLGTTTKMTAELYAELKEKGYGLNDMVGDSGIEQAMESYLRGEDGEMTVNVDANGNVTTEITKEPVQGRTIVLTIDKDLQKLAQDQLAETILVRSPSQKDNPNAGAVVVQNVRNGEILAAASFPTYDLSTYRDEYDKLSKQSDLPLWNRFALGTYSPGSTFKPSIALAALETGTITDEYYFTCTGTMQFRGQTIQCQGGDSHGRVNVYSAIAKSCNLFFHSISQQLGIQKMNEFDTDLGFGQKTGVEISEAKGILSSKEYAEAIGADWTAGHVYQSAIGQAYNQATMLQLASYTSTLANGGTRYQSHFVKEILSYDCSEVISTAKPNVFETLDLTTDALSKVQQGMRDVATKPYGSTVNSMKDASVPMAAKTGTAEVIIDGEKFTNGFLISFAPYENPEIAMAAVMEHSSGGAFMGKMERAITESYFSNTEFVKRPQGYIELLP